MSSSKGPKIVGCARDREKLNKTSTDISGTAGTLQATLKRLDAEIKAGQQGQAEFQAYLKRLTIERQDLEARIRANQEWVASCEAQQAGQGAFEQQYRSLLDEITRVYESAKECHSKGIDLLIKEFDYHVAYKRWNDTFTAVPFKPK